MATTTNFGWETPDDTDLVKDGAAAIRTALGGVDTSFVDLKGGTTGQLLSKASNTDLDYTWTTPATGGQFSPNLIINGAFIVNQRGYVSAANLASGAYGFDRWKSTFTNTSLTYTAGVNATTVTISSGGSIEQIIERENVPAGTYTLSWSGTATARVYNTGGTPGSYAASPVTFTSDGLANVEVEFTASCGTRTLGLVKFERGSTATTYSLAGGTYQGELAACRRYYFRTLNAAAYTSYATIQCNTSTAGYGAFVFPVSMRTAPTSVEYANLRLLNVNSSAAAVTALTLDTPGNDSTRLDITVASMTSGVPAILMNNNSTSGYIAFNAEL
jgi:hypothetical protein